MKREQTTRIQRIRIWMIELLIELYKDYALLLKERRGQEKLRYYLRKNRVELEADGWRVNLSDCSISKVPVVFHDSIIKRAKVQALHLGMRQVIITRTRHNDKRIICLNPNKKWMVGSEMLRLLIIIPLAVVSIIGVVIFMLI